MASLSRKRKADPPHNFVIKKTPQEEVSNANPPHRSEDEETEDWLNNNCTGWNQDNKTYMIPSEFPYKTEIHGKPDVGKLAEKRVYDLLKEFGENTDQPMLVVYSYQFHQLVDYFEEGPSVKSKYWMKGEHDFVIIHREFGIVFMQVKAAVKTEKEYKNADKQLDKDITSLTNALKKKLTISKKRKVKDEVQKEMKTRHPAVVVMPNCPRHKAGADKPGCYQEDCATWAAFKTWWDANIPYRPDEFTLYEQMAMRFVSPAILQVKYDETGEMLYQLTMEQLNYYRNDTPKQYITGPAGSGKTWLLVQKAKEVAESNADHKVLILCYNKPLSLYLENEFPEGEYTNVRIMTLWSLLLCKIKKPTKALSELSLTDKKELVYECVDELNDSSKSQGCRIYVSEHIFVDEAQDMYEGWWKLVDALHNNSKTETRYKWVFLDTNQLVYNRGLRGASIPPEIFTDAKKMNTIIRNTHRIFDCSNKFLTLCGAKLGHSVRGPDVKWIDSLSGRQVHHLIEGAKLVKEEVRDLKRKQVAMSDIVVLTRNKKESDLLKGHLSKESKDIETQDAEQAIKDPKQSAITVDSIRRFKGLERKVVILVDPPFDDERESEKGLTYVGMSRSFCLLVILTTKEFKEKYSAGSQQEHTDQPSTSKSAH
ncbi:uncharacterized protein LOC144869695 [Branchiostoma floridae x Branchiostoma japonicum]